MSVEPRTLSLNVLYRLFARNCTDAAWRLKLSFIDWLSPFFPRMSVLCLTRKALAVFKKHFKALIVDSFENLHLGYIKHSTLL